MFGSHFNKMSRFCHLYIYIPCSQTAWLFWAGGTGALCSPEATGVQTWGYESSKDPPTHPQAAWCTLTISSKRSRLLADSGNVGLQPSIAACSSWEIPSADASTPPLGGPAWVSALQSRLLKTANIAHLSGYEHSCGWRSGVLGWSCACREKKGLTFSLSWQKSV